MEGGIEFDLKLSEDWDHQAWMKYSREMGIQLDETGKAKYYTPEVHEFCVGFEFEHFYEKGKLLKHKSNTCGWKQDVFDWSWADIIYDDYEHNTEELGKYRVKYLDLEDIESLGFKHLGSMWFSIDAPSEMGTWNEIKLRWWSDQRVYITGHRGDESEPLFQGSIKNKFELQKVLKQLAI